MDLSLLLSDEKYQELFDKHGHATPYIFNIKHGKQALFYFGVRHSRNPSDAQWLKLEKYFKKFLAEAGRDRVVLLEGNRFPVQVMTRDDAIIQFGERGLLAQLAIAANIKFQWPELTQMQEMNKLVQTFDSDTVYFFFFMRSVGAWLRAKTMGDFTTIISKAAQTTNRRIPSAPADVATYVAIYERIFTRPLAESETKTIQRAAAPVYHDSIINDIARAASRTRNEHIVLEVERLWREGKSIFMLFGTAHAVIQEKALRSLVE